jgi:hypothetical protein
MNQLELFPTATKDQAKEAAKSLIRYCVLRGDNRRYIRNGCQGHSGDTFSAMVDGQKIVVTEIECKPINRVFKLNTIIEAIKQEAAAQGIECAPESSYEDSDEDDSE